MFYADSRETKTAILKLIARAFQFKPFADQI